MRIGIDARMMGPEQTGIGAYVQQLIERIPTFDPENEYVIFLRDQFFLSWKPTTPNVRTVLAPYRWYTWVEQLLFPLLLLKQRLDLMHFPNFNVPILYPKPYVVTIHDTTPLFFHGHRMSSRVRRLGFALVFRLGIRRAKRIVAVSRAAADDVMRSTGIKSDKISVIHNGFSQRFAGETDRAILSGISSHFHITPPYLLWAGVWRNHKNITGLIEAFALLRSRYGHDLRLVLVGKELSHYSEPRQTWERLSISDHIIRAGFVSDDELAALYANASVCVVPSFMEGFGLNGLEAMSAKIPVAASDIASLREIYGDAAAYFDPHEPDDMARVLHALLSSPTERERLIAAGAQRIARYSWNESARAHARLYRTLIADFHAKKETEKTEEKNTGS